MHLGIGAGKDLAIGVIQLEFHLQGAQVGSRAFDGAHRLRRRRSSPVLGKAQLGREPRAWSPPRRPPAPARRSAACACRRHETIRCPLLWPALISAPMSVLRAVTTPSKGATTRLNDSRSRKRATLAAAESTWLSWRRHRRLFHRRPAWIPTRWRATPSSARWCCSIGFRWRAPSRDRLAPGVNC
jgi:hypothetical protein